MEQESIRQKQIIELQTFLIKMMRQDIQIFAVDDFDGEQTPLPLNFLTSQQEKNIKGLIFEEVQNRIHQLKG